MSDPHDSQARIGRAGAPDETIGCGLLVTPRHVVTCAHVVAQALGTAATIAQAPTGSIPIELPLLARPFRTTGRVIRWLPVREAEDKAPEDVAVLELADEVPPEAEPAPLLRLEPNDYTDLPVHCFGFPSGIDEGVRRPGICRGENALGWVQVDVERGLVEGGFSGTGAWDPNQAAAVGLVVAARTAEQSAALIPARTLFTSWPELDSTWLPRNPYKGLAAFDEDDAERFFGREALTEKLWEALRAPQMPVGEASPMRLLAVFGPSGCGKSSVVRAGLLPELARRPLPGLERARVAVLTPGTHPVEALATVLARIATDDATPLAKARELTEELRRPPHDGLRRIGNSLPGSASAPLVVLVDQFEETYALCQDAAERDAFVANLLTAAADRDARVSVVLTLRSDFLGATMRHPALNAAIAAPGILVPAMCEEELRRAIAEPALRAGRPLEPAIVDRLIAETLGREGALPLLEFTLTRIWEGLVGGKTPSETLRDLGGVGGALAGEAERLFERLNTVQQQIARRAFLALVRLGEGTRDTRRRAALAEMVAAGEQPEAVQAVLSAFARPGERLVTLYGDGDQVLAEVTHEALFEHWSRLQDWLATGRDDLRFHRRLADAAMHWDASGRPDGLLWRPPDLDLLNGFQRRAGADLTALEVDFHLISSAREGARRLLKRVTVSGLVILLLVVAGLGAFAEYQRREAEVARRHAESQETLATARALEADVARRRAEAQETLATARALAAQANHLARGTSGDGLVRSTLVSIESLRRKPTLEGRMALLADLALLRRPLARLAHDGVVEAVAFSPDGTRLATASSNYTAWASPSFNYVRLSDVATGQELARLAHDHAERAVAFSPDSTLR